MRDKPKPPLLYWTRLTRAQMNALLKIWRRDYHEYVIAYSDKKKMYYVIDLTVQEGRSWPSADKEVVTYVSKNHWECSHWINQHSASYLHFRRTAKLDRMLGCVMVPWKGMVLGIEKDGHTHS
jgi:hypothetical protein